jgi:putative flavoprotein involved in K+ transport
MRCSTPPMPDSAMSPADPATTLAAWAHEFGEALQAQAPDHVALLFAEDCYWRDLIAFTWTIRTLEGRAAIHDMVQARAGLVRPHGWTTDGATEKNGIVEGWLSFETEVASCRGYVRLKDGKCWTLLTAGRALKGHEEAEGTTRERGAPLPHATDRRSWLERRI